jgi:hypothetical protein
MEKGAIKLVPSMARISVIARTELTTIFYVRDVPSGRSYRRRM